jgi:sec-independent protein translocase protein TatB
MFDFAWTEIALIAAVALIAIGPKDMPVAIRSITGMIKKARRMASEFQTHVDEMMREANLQEVRDQINEIRNFDVRGEIERNIDPDGSLRTTFTSNPLQPETAATPATTGTAEPPLEGTAAQPQEHAALAVEEPAAPAAPEAPAFIPPGAVPPEHEAAPRPAAATEAPAFIPPGIVLQRHDRPAA